MSRVEELRDRIQRAKSKPYRANLERELADLLAPVAEKVLEARLLAPEPEPGASPPKAAGWMPTEEDLEAGGFDLQATLEGVLTFWRKDGIRTLKRKGKRGDLAALKELGTLTRMLIQLDADRTDACPRPCCKKPVRPAREVRILDPHDPVAVADAEAREARGECTIFRPAWPAEGSKS